MLRALAIYLLSAMVSMEPMTNQASYEKPEMTEARYTAFAYNTAAVVLQEEPLQSSRLETGLILVNIWHKESHGDAKVMLCKRGGDEGMAWGSFQTHRNRRETCESFYGAARVALDMARESFDLVGDLSIYTDGLNWRTRRAKRRSLERTELGRRFLIEHSFPIVVLDDVP